MMVGNKVDRLVSLLLPPACLSASFVASICKTSFEPGLFTDSSLRGFSKLLCAVMGTPPLSWESFKWSLTPVV